MKETEDKKFRNGNILKNIYINFLKNILVKYGLEEFVMKSKETVGIISQSL